MMTTRELKEFTLANGEPYFRGSGGIITRAMFEGEAKEELKRVHDLSCGDNNIFLSRRLQRQSYYWSGMAKDATNIQRSCSKCQEALDADEYLFFEEA